MHTQFVGSWHAHFDAVLDAGDMPSPDVFLPSAVPPDGYPMRNTCHAVTGGWNPQIEQEDVVASGAQAVQQARRATLGPRFLTGEINAATMTIVHRTEGEPASIERHRISRRRTTVLETDGVVRCASLYAVERRAVGRLHEQRVRAGIV